MKLSDLKSSAYEQVNTQDKSPSALMKIVNSLANFGIGIGTEIGKTGLGLGQLGSKGLGYLTNNEFYKKQVPETIEKIKKGMFEDPFKDRTSTLSGKAGEITGTIAEFLSPTNLITKGQKILGPLSKLAPKGTQTLTKVATRVTPEATADFLTQLARTGGDVESAKEQALLTAGTVGTLNVLGNTVRATYWPELKESMIKALGLSGTESAGRVLPGIERKVSGFAVLKDMKPEITDLYGNKKVFDPTNATYFDTVQAVVNTKKQLYNEYTNLAKKAGEKATADISEITRDLGAVSEQARTSDVKSAAKSILADFYDNFAVKLPDGSVMIKDADLDRLQTFLEDLNNSAASTLAGKSDKAYGEMAADVTTKLRAVMDDVISRQTGEQYQALRTKYASVRSIEDDLVRKFKQDARKIGGGLTDYIYLMNTPDIIVGLATANPAQVTGAASSGLLAAIRKYLIQPERYLRRTFDLIDSKGASDLSIRLFGATDNKPMTETEQRLADYIKNIKPGMTIEDITKKSSQFKSYEDFENAININYEKSWKGDKDLNADELIKSFKGLSFHGTNASENILKEGYKKDRYWNSGVYFSDTPERAIEYMKQNRSPQGKGSDVLVNDLTNLKIKQGEGEIVRKISKGYDGMEDFVLKLKKQGYDGIKDAYGETLVWNTEKIQIPRKLRDIWKKAQEITPPAEALKKLGIKSDDVISVKQFGSSVEGKTNPNDIDHFIIVKDGSMKFKVRDGLNQPIIKNIGKNQYIIMPETDGQDLLNAMLYTGMKDQDRMYSGKTIDLTKGFKNLSMGIIPANLITKETIEKAKEMGYGNPDEGELQAIQDEETIKKNELPSNNEIKRQIAWRESRGEKDPYRAINENNNGTTDYGKYQINEDTLKTYSKKYLGKEVSPQEFLDSPELQEEFMDKTIEHLKELGVKKFDSLLVLHHKGYGDISTARINQLKQNTKVKQYLNTILE